MTDCWQHSSTAFCKHKPSPPYLLLIKSTAGGRVASGLAKHKEARAHRRCHMGSERVQQLPCSSLKLGALPRVSGKEPVISPPKFYLLRV